MNALDYPVALQLQGKRVLLVGAGKIAQGRLRQLLEVGAKVRVVAPEATEEIRALARAGRISLEERPFARGDCFGALVVFTAADDHAVNRAVVREARHRGILVNAADVPELCDFTIPSIGRRGPVTVAVSTSGRAPALARALKEVAMLAIRPEHGRLATLIGRLRRLEPASPERTRRIQALVDSNATDLLRRGELRQLGRLVRALWQPIPDEPAVRMKEAS